jgi:hypothetical protein
MQTVKNLSERRARTEEGEKFSVNRSVDFIPKRAVVRSARPRQLHDRACRNHRTMRHKIGRMRRLVYAFSKKMEHHRAAVELNYCWYNLACVVKGLRMSPAMAAGITDHNLGARGVHGGGTHGGAV